MGMVIPSKHAKNWRADLKDLPWSEDVKDTIEWCWQPDPKQRPTFEEIKEQVDLWKRADIVENSPSSGLKRSVKNIEPLVRACGRARLW